MIPPGSETVTDPLVMRRGDCIAEGGLKAFDDRWGQVCTNNGETISTKTITIPGLHEHIISPLTVNSCNPMYQLNAFLDPYNTAIETAEKYMMQSEPFAVLHHRNQNLVVGEDQDKWRGADGTPMTRSSGVTVYSNSCMVNMPTQIDDGGTMRWRARWIPINLLGNLELSGNNVGDLTNATIGSIKSNARMYNQTPGADESDPSISHTNSRFDNNTPLARLFSSNEAKLPAIGAVGTVQGNQICNSYPVNIGYMDKEEVDGGVFTQSNAITLNKRLLRRTESILIASHPKNITADEAMNIEQGGIASSSSFNLDSNNTNCNTYKRAITNGQNAASLDHEDLMDPFYGDAADVTPGAFARTDRPFIMGGSSVFDHDGDNKNTQSCTSRLYLRNL